MIYRSTFLRSIYLRRFSQGPPVGSSFDFYDLVVNTPRNPTHPIEASLMSDRDLRDLKKMTKTTYTGNYALDETLTPEERIAKVFGGRIKGEAPRSSSRVDRGEPRNIAGVIVPEKPLEPDNCCMSGCINCVWELYNDDVKEWNLQRKKAADMLAKKGGRWPEGFYPPVLRLKKDNLPLSLVERREKGGIKEGKMLEEEESWGNVPVAIRVFAEMEKKMKAKKAAASREAGAIRG